MTDAIENTFRRPRSRRASASPTLHPAQASPNYVTVLDQQLRLAQRRTITLLAARRFIAPRSADVAVTFSHLLRVADSASLARSFAFRRLYVTGSHSFLQRFLPPVFP